MNSHQRRTDRRRQMREGVPFMKVSGKWHKVIALAAKGFVPSNMKLATGKEDKVIDI